MLVISNSVAYANCVLKLVTHWLFSGACFRRLFLAPKNRRQ